MARKVDDNESCILAINLALKKVDAMMKFQSRSLITGQEDNITLNEYEALAKLDMEVCTEALRILRDLITAKEAYLRAKVDSFKVEQRLPSTLEASFKRIDMMNARITDYTGKMNKGDFSFLKKPNDSNATCCKDKTAVPSTSANSVRLEEEPNEEVAFVSVKQETDADNAGLDDAVAATSKSTISSTYNPDVLADYMKPRQRPQFSSDIARKIVADIDKQKEDRSTVKNTWSSIKNRVFSPIAEVETRLNENLNVTQKANNNMQEDITTRGGIHSGGGSLDGSFLDTGSGQSSQNGLCIRSPLTQKVPAPNFDDTVDFDVDVPIKIVKPVPIYSNATARNPLPDSKEKENKEGSIRSNTEPNAGSTAAAVSSLFAKPQRPTFSSSFGQKYNINGNN